LRLQCKLRLSTFVAREAHLLRSIYM
jgi:hypothetical protein